MAEQKGLSESERNWLSMLDALLMHPSPVCHEVAALKITELWSEKRTVFQCQLISRAEHWRRQHEEIQTIWQRGKSGAFQTLLRLMRITGIDSPSGTTKPQPRRRAPIIAPSHRLEPGTRPITDDEASRFGRLLDKEGLRAVFDPANRVMDDMLFRPALITLAQTAVRHDQVWPLYESGSIKRPWDPQPRTPETALAMDLALLATLTERRWTWAISDHYLCRLPLGHPLKATAAGRPGWPFLCTVLTNIGLLTRRHGKTWGLTPCARKVCSALAEVWKRAAG